MSLRLSARFFNIIRNNKVAFELNCKNRIFLFRNKFFQEKSQKLDALALRNF